MKLGEPVTMWKYAICNETFGDLDWAATCHQIASLGYDGVEVAPFTLGADIRLISASARREYAAIARRSGLEIVGLHWLLVSPDGLSLTGSEASVRAETARYLAALVDFCADMGGRIMVLGSPKQRRIPSGDTASLAADRLAEALIPALSRATARDITLCLEPLPPPEADLILTLHEAIEIVTRLNHPQLRAILDIKSASSESTPIPALIARYAPYLAHVHANDANRRGPGFGDTDYTPILAALHAAHYHAYISVEVFDYSPDAITIARDSLAYLKRSADALDVTL